MHKDIIPEGFLGAVFLTVYPVEAECLLRFKIMATCTIRWPGGLTDLPFPRFGCCTS